MSTQKQLKVGDSITAFTQNLTALLTAATLAYTTKTAAADQAFQDETAEAVVPAKAHADEAKSELCAARNAVLAARAAYLSSKTADERAANSRAYDDALANTDAALDTFNRLTATAAVVERTVNRKHQKAINGALNEYQGAFEAAIAQTVGTHVADLNAIRADLPYTNNYAELASCPDEAKDGDKKTDSAPPAAGDKK